MTDPSTLARAITGDRDACAELVSEFYPACLRVADRMLRNRADAEDVVQDTFLRAIRGLPGYDQRAPFRAWLFHILINQCRSRGSQRSREERRQVADPGVVDRLSAQPVPGATGGDLDRIIAAVEELEPLMREAFVLKYVEELEYTEMAAITGASISALKMRVKRACDTLRPRLEVILA